MNIYIKRYRVNSEVTDGRLFIENQFICDTTEATKTILPPGIYQVVLFKCTRSKRQIPIVKTDGDHSYQGLPTPHQCKSCSEAESQRIKIRRSEYYQIEKASQSDTLSYSEMITVEKQITAEAQVKLAGHQPAKCPKLYFGNGTYNRSDGSILVGNYYLPGVVLHSRQIFDRLYNRMEKAIARGAEVKLFIS